MKPVIDYYFDFISPFAYLAWQKLPGLAERYGHDVACHVVDLAALKLLAGNTGPTNRSIPLKTRYLQFDKKRWAERYGVAIVNPASWDSSLVNMGFLFAADHGAGYRYLDVCWKRVWGEGGDMGADAFLERLAQELGWDAVQFLSFVRGEEAERRYREVTRAAHEAKVFGVPTMIAGEDMWWGNDRLEFLEEHLSRQGGRR